MTTRVGTSCWELTTPGHEYTHGSPANVLKKIFILTLITTRVMEVLHIFFSCSGEFLIISAFITISATTVLSNFTSSTDNLIKFVAKQDCDTTKNDIRQNFYFLQNWRFAVLFSLRQLNL